MIPPKIVARYRDKLYSFTYALWSDGLCVRKDRFGNLRHKMPHEKYFW